MILKISRWLAFGLMIFLLCGTVIAATPGAGENETGYEPMSFNFNNADLPDMLRIVAKISGKNIIVDPELNGRITCKLEQTPWNEALKKIVDSIGLDMFINGNVIRIFKPDPKNEKQIQAAAERKYSGKAIDLELKNADLVTTLKSLAEQDNKKIQIPEQVKGKVSIHLVKVPLDQILDVILQLNGLEMKLEGDLITVL